MKNYDLTWSIREGFHFRRAMGSLELDPELVSLIFPRPFTNPFGVSCNKETRATESVKKLTEYLPQK